MNDPHLSDSGITKQVFHADRKAMPAKHADGSVPLASSASAGHGIVDWR
jgi:hypothetical protein